ncbi:MAG: [Fe-Fe] hydrogenase large subunit C-terminal domain-containing protein [Oscillospiraceae bacterium]
MTSVLQLKKSNCKNCYKCIRECPVKAIKFSEHQANIINDECIYCGSCFVTCPQNAKKIRNDIDILKGLLSSKKPVYLSVAPSFIAEYNLESFDPMIEVGKKLGFFDVQETAIGAEIVKREYENILETKKPKILISSCCHSINLLIQKYYPQLLGMLANVMSPMQAHASYIKEQNPEAYVVFVGPCVAKKEEGDRYKIVDCVLTFEEWNELMGENNINFDEIKHQHQPIKTGLFPTTGGIIKSMNKQDDYTYIAVDGTKNCITALDEISKGGLSNYFIEMSACVGSCVGGPVMGEKRNLQLTTKNKVKNYVGECENLAIDNAPNVDKSLAFLGINHSVPSEKEIKEMLKKMGKTLPEHELNCGTCGYNTCREKAIAIIYGKADLTMCLPFLKEKAESFSDTIINNTTNSIIVMDDKLLIQSINRAGCNLFNLQNPSAIIGQPIDNLISPVQYVNVLEEKTPVVVKKQYLVEYDKYVEESIIFDKDYDIIISIMRDITEKEIQNNEKIALHQNTAEIADKVIEKQLRVVQEIASLLGETAAETKIALTNLKDALSK